MSINKMDPSPESTGNNHMETGPGKKEGVHATPNYKLATRFGHPEDNGCF
jgi:hypothetical protein